MSPVVVCKYSGFKIHVVCLVTIMFMYVSIMLGKILDSIGFYVCMYVCMYICITLGRGGQM